MQALVCDGGETHGPSHLFFFLYRCYVISAEAPFRLRVVR